MSEPVEILVKRWKCPHCSRSRTRRTATAEHIARCWFNPDNRTCKTCIFHFPGSGGASMWCVPGRPCNCNEAEPSCDAGVKLPHPEAGSKELEFVTHCPKWHTRDDEPENVYPLLAPTSRS